MVGDVIEVTDDEFTQMVLESKQPVLVDFWAEWCVPCHMIASAVEEIASEQGGILRVVKLNVDDNPRTTEQFRVLSIPTLVLFHQGKERARVVGAHDKASILGALGDSLAA